MAAKIGKGNDLDCKSDAELAVLDNALLDFHVHICNYILVLRLIILITKALNF